MGTATEDFFGSELARRASCEEAANPLQGFLANVVDIGLASIICVAPFFFGGRHDLGRLVFVALVAATSVAWFLHQLLRPSARWVPTLAHGIIVLAVLLVALQITPLPEGWIEKLAPRHAELLPLWSFGNAEHGAFGHWNTLSLAPHDTAKGLAVLLGYGLLFVVVVQRIKGSTDVARLLRWIGLSAILMAGFGLVQYFASNGRYFWFYDYPDRTTSWWVCGSFINRNHFASFLVLGIGALTATWINVLRQRSAKRGAHGALSLADNGIVGISIGAGIAIVLFAILLSASRGGLLALLTSVAVTGTIYSRRRLVNSKYVWGTIGLGAVMLGLLSLYGYDRVAGRFQSLTRGSMEDLDQDEGRRKIWTANVAAFRADPIVGAGVGSHRMIYPVYLPESSTQEYTHAENGYLQIATETGVAGVALLVVGLGLCISWCVTCFRSELTDSQWLWFGACAGGLAASAVHSIVDFVWYIPACMSITVVLAGCTLRLAQQARVSSDGRSEAPVVGRLAWFMGAALAVSIGAWMISTMLGPGMASIYWDRYLNISRSNGKALDQSLLDLIADRDNRSPDDEQYRSQSMLDNLAQVIRWDPCFARAQLRLAALQINEFERRQQSGANPMDVSQIRDAVVASHFASSDDLRAWLRRAFGADADSLCRALAHARAGVTLCPLQGEGYLALAKLCFLEGEGQQAVAAYIDQGLRVRPYDGDILFEGGRQQLLSGDVNGALAHWTQCYRDAGPHQLRIIYLLAGRIPAAMFLATFQPDWQTLWPIWRRYRQGGEKQDLDGLATYAYQAAQRETLTASEGRAASIWRWQATMFSDLGQADKAMECLQRAYVACPRVYAVRYELGLALLNAGDFAKAEPHLRWCLSRHPESKQLSDALLLVVKGRLAQQEHRTDSNVRQASTLGL